MKKEEDKVTKSPVNSVSLLMDRDRGAWFRKRNREETRGEKQEDFDPSILFSLIVWLCVSWVLCLHLFISFLFSSLSFLIQDLHPLSFLSVPPSSLMSRAVTPKLNPLSCLLRQLLSLLFFSLSLCFRENKMIDPETGSETDTVLYQ